MSKNFYILMKYHFMKAWNPGVIVFASLTLLFVSSTVFIPIFSGFNEEMMIKEFDFNFILNIPLKIFTGIFPLILGIGMVSFDYRSHYLRSVLTRAVTPDDYMMAKIAANLGVFSAVLLLTVTLPVSLAAAFSNMEIIFDFGSAALVHLFAILLALQILFMSFFFSVWVPTFVNMLILVLWFLADAIAGAIISQFFWDNPIAIVMQDFFFPSGLQSMIDVISQGGKFDYQNLLWGLAALFLFGFLASVSINNKNPDKGSD